MTTAAASNFTTVPVAQNEESPIGGDTIWRQIFHSRRVLVGGSILLAMLLLCLATLPWTLHAGPDKVPVYESMDSSAVRHAPTFSVRGIFGYDSLGRSLFARCLVGGTISLAVGIAAATVAVGLGVLVGLIAGYRGGWVDSLLMRIVDILYGLPYILLVILFKIALEHPLTTLRWGMIEIVPIIFAIVLLVAWAMTQARSGQAIWRIGVAFALAALAVALPFLHKTNPTDQAANLMVLFLAIGLVSWLTMARVIRGQVLSLRGQPFIEACKAMGLRHGRIFGRHILPNLIGPITVYATLTVPAAILYESFLSFLGIGVSPPLATWGSLASEGVEQLNPFKFYWWQLLFPCALLAITLLSLNFLGDGLRDVFDPKKEAAKI